VELTAERREPDSGRRGQPGTIDSSAAQGITGPLALRILLGTKLRRLREAAGVTAQQAARAISGSESKISRIELGRNAIRLADVSGLLDCYRITDRAERERLLALARQANQPGWWQRFADVLPGWYQAYVGLEESAESIHSYDTQFIPGLLQTEDYAAGTIALGEFPIDEAERLVVLRKERQRRFSTGNMRLHAIIDEQALRRPVVGPALMRTQLEYLCVLADRPNVTVQVAPLAASVYAPPTSCTILHFASADLPDVVYVEQLTGALYLDRPADLARYAAVLSQLVARSAGTAESIGIIRSVLHDLERSRHE